jgi:formate/nitrite transporter FocA (FNT family)
MAKQEPETTTDTSRRSAHEIFTAALSSAKEELKRSSVSLMFSGLAGGITMGLTGLSVAVLGGALSSGKTEELISYLGYPVGFIAVIIGRAQLFTENTLFPVIVVLDERKQILNTLRLWAVIFLANVVGAFLFALLAAKSSALSPEIREHLLGLGAKAVQYPFAHIFWSGIVGGWLIALVAWIVTASHWSIAQIVITYLLTFVVGAGHFAHCIAGSGEILAAVVAGKLAASTYLYWLTAATLGNVLGGVVLVSLLNWGQVAVTTEHPETA